MSTYEEKRTARLDRLRARAARLSRAADASHARAAEIASLIPMGQPILVGHHSQRRHERDIGRITRGYERASRLRSEAEATARRVAAAESNRAISSDDPNAVEKLRAKLARLDDDRARMVQANKATRSKEPRGSLKSLGFSEKTVDELLTPDFMGRVGFPDFALRNAAGESARLRKRIGELEARRTAPSAPPLEVYGVRVEEADNRVRITFAERPTAERCAALKRAGFRWAPSVGAWQRHASPGAWYAAKRLLGVTERGAA